MDPNVKSDQTMSAKELMSLRAETAKPVVLPTIVNRPQIEEPQQDNDEQLKSPADDDKVDQGHSGSEDESIQIEFDDEGNEISQPPANKPKKVKKQLTEEERNKKAENLRKLREQLASKINTFKERRKAPGTKNGGSIKSRDQILAERKRKAELKQKEKMKRKLEEEEEGEVDTNSESEPEAESDPEQEQKDDDNVFFGNITFTDGTRLTSDLSKLRNTADKRKAKGPANNDIKAHLLKLEKKKALIAKLSPEEQVKKHEKDKWQKLMSQAEGIKVKDDEKLLKKALKRKEKQKLKSEIEWKDRKQIVKDTIAAKIKKRDENLRLRKENKGKPRKNQVRLKKFTGIMKTGKPKQKRAGFEGSSKSKKK